MSHEFVLLFLGVILGYMLAELVSVEWAIAIVVAMIIVAIFHKPKKPGTA